MSLPFRQLLCCLALPLLAFVLMGHAGDDGGALNGTVIVAAAPSHPAALGIAERAARELAGAVRAIYGIH